MIRKIAFAAVLFVSWTIIVASFVLIEALWFAEPDLVRGDLRSIREHLDGRLTVAADDGRLGAASLAIIQDGETVFVKGYGIAENGSSVDPEKTLFQVGSISKMVTAAGVMKLVQDGQLSLDEPVVGRLKRWRFAGGDQRMDRITIRHLLSHTGGVQDPPGYAGSTADEEAPSIIDYLEGVKIVGEPGSEMAYGNASTAILQLLLEDVTGTPFPSYMQSAVLQPFGMTNSTFDLDIARSRLAPAFDGNLAAQPPSRHSIASAVALYTNARDLALFAQALGRDNGPLNGESLEQMMRPVAGTGGTWGLGLNLFVPTEDGGFILGHDGGAAPAWGGMVRFNPKTQNGMVVTVSGGRGAANMLSHDWVYWESGKLTTQARR